MPASCVAMSDTPNKQDTPASPLKTNQPKAADAEDSPGSGPAEQANSATDKIRIRPAKSLSKEPSQDIEPGKDAGKKTESSTSAAKSAPPKLAPSKPAVAVKPGITAKKAVSAKPKPRSAAPDGPPSTS